MEERHVFHQGIDISTSGAQADTTNFVMRLKNTRRGRIKEYIEKYSEAVYTEYGTPGNYMAGANIAGFLKVVNAMLDQGLV